MIMAVKHQVLMSPNPRHLIMVTLNHLDAMTDYATNPVTKKNIHTTYELLIQVMLQHLRPQHLPLTAATVEC